MGRRESPVPARDAARGTWCASPSSGSAWLPSSRPSSPGHWKAADDVISLRPYRGGAGSGREVSPARFWDQPKAPAHDEYVRDDTPAGKTLAQGSESLLQFCPAKEDIVSLAHAASRSRADR